MLPKIASITIEQQRAVLEMGCRNKRGKFTPTKLRYLRSLFRRITSLILYQLKDVPLSNVFKFPQHLTITVKESSHAELSEDFSVA